jgi:hypothetical protein
MRRSEYHSCPQPPSTCARIRRNYLTELKFREYKEANLNIDELGNYVSGGNLASDLGSKKTDAEQRLQTNFTILQMAEANVQNIMKCLQSDIIERQCHAGKVYSIQEEIQTAKKEADETAQVAKDAKERADLLREPYSKTTRWELWFPIGRPLQKESVPVLLSVAILLLVLSLGMFLRLTSFGFSFGRLPQQIGGFSSYLSTK